MVGARVSETIDVGGTPVALDLRLRWEHEFGDTALSVTNAFLGGQGTGFTVYTPNLAREHGVVGGGISAPVAPNLRLFARCEADVSRNTSVQSVRGGAIYQF